MAQGVYIEFKEESGIGDLLFVNKYNPWLYRFYRRKSIWDECYMVEFCTDSSDYQFYWGHNDSDRGMIDVTTLLSPQDPEIEWKRIKFEPLLAYNLPKIIMSVEKGLSKKVLF
jgi:hypothetical protein